MPAVGELLLNNNACVLFKYVYGSIQITTKIKVQMTEVRSVFRENTIRDLMHSLQGNLKKS